VVECLAALGTALPGLTASPVWAEAARAVVAAAARATPAAVAGTLLETTGKVGTSPDATWCPNASYFELLPVTVATLTPGNASVSWVGDGVFSGMAASAKFASSGVSVTLTGSGATGAGLDEYYIIATSADLTLASVSVLGATTTTTLNYTVSYGAQDAALNGVNVHLLPCGLLGTLQSVLRTASLFSGNNSALAAANIDFLVERGVWPSATPFGGAVNVDTSNIKSGDYLAIARLDGLDPMIMFGTGGVTGHSAIAVWDAGTLYVCESTDANPFGPVYWPPPYGIIRHEFSEWFTLAQAAGYHVSLLPIAPELAAAFNETAYWTWFATVQGMPSLDKLLGNATAGVSVYSMLTWGLNMRMNTTCTTLSCIIGTTVANQVTGRGPTSFVQAAAIPEDDSWLFGANYSMVCSEFAAHGWKTGLIGANPLWASISAGEQTPKDNYQMAIYDPARFTTANCPGGLMTDPTGTGTYCQLMGEYVMYLNGYNSIPLYAGINNACPAQWPAYVRCPPGNPTCC